jgi:hypothetical protein
MWEKLNTSNANEHNWILNVMQQLKHIWEALLLPYRTAYVKLKPNNVTGFITFQNPCSYIPPVTIVSGEGEGEENDAIMLATVANWDA